MEHVKILQSLDIDLVATGTTGKYVEETGLKVTKFLSGPLGGDAEIAARVARKRQIW